jgi:hypothetical protein
MRFSGDVEASAQEREGEAKGKPAGEAGARRRSLTFCHFVVDPATYLREKPPDYFSQNIKY